MTANIINMQIFHLSLQEFKKIYESNFDKNLYEC